MNHSLPCLTQGRIPSWGRNEELSGFRDPTQPWRTCWRRPQRQELALVIKIGEAGVNLLKSASKMAE